MKPRLALALFRGRVTVFCYWPFHVYVDREEREISLVWRWQLKRWSWPKQPHPVPTLVRGVACGPVDVRWLVKQ